LKAAHYLQFLIVEDVDPWREIHSLINLPPEQYIHAQFLKGKNTSCGERKGTPKVGEKQRVLN
jgi:hypothetical protein